MDTSNLSLPQRKALEERASLQEELLRRRRDDPLVLFKPNPGGQSKFIHSVLYGSLMENWFIAANRAGKSDAGAFCGATLARYGDPRAKFVGGAGSSIQIKDRATSGWVISLDFPSSRDIVQPKYFDNGFLPPGASHQPFIPEREIDEWRVSDQILRLKNGSIIGFKSADSGRIKFQGTEKDWAHFDEESPYSIYEETVIRVGARKLRVFGTCTLLPPEGQTGGITWVYEQKVRPWKNGQNPEIGIFTASIYDNPYIDPDEIRRLESLYPPGSTQRRIRLNGELIGGVGGARVYSGFQYQLNVREQPAIQLRRPLAWIWDFNVEPMVSLIGQYDRGLFRVYRELILDEGNIGEMCEKFRQIHPYHLAEVHLYGDASGRDRSHQTNATSYTLILNNMVDYPAPVKEHVQEKNPAITDRINAVNRVFKDEEGVVRVEIDPGCSELIEDFDQVISDGKGGIKKTFSRKDPYFKRTHTSDAFGYWVTYLAPVQSIGHRPEQSIRVKMPAIRYSTPI